MKDRPRLPIGLLCLGLALLSLGMAVNAQQVKIGVLTDMSGPYSDASGEGGVVAAQMAVDDATAEEPALAVTLLSADHQNKPDIGSAIARRWFADGVDAITGLQNSGVALAVQQIGRQEHKILLISGGSSSDLTGRFCSPYTAHWTDDTYMLASATARALLAQGGDTWFFITVDYTFGKELEATATAVIQQNGGKVVGSVKHPLNTSDFSSYLLAAQASGAKVIAFADAGNDTITAIKQGHEFGLGARQKLAAMALLITDVHGLGLEAAQGLNLTVGFYWDRTSETRAWSHRFFDRIKRMPTREQAETYSAVLHYLRAVAATGTTDADRVIGRMKSTEVNDFYATGATLRADGRLIHTVYGARVKSPAETKYPWDYYQLTEQIPGQLAFRPLAEGGCSFVSND